MPDMGKRFSHHTNRENPLTRFFRCYGKLSIRDLSELPFFAKGLQGNSLIIITFKK